MSIEMSKTRRILFIISLMLTNIAVMGDNLLYPVTANIYAEFADQSMLLINYVVSGPLIIIFVVSLLAAPLLTRMSQKSMLMIGGTMFAVSTIFGAAVPSIVYMAVMRTLTGIGQALVNVAAMSLLSEVYTDETQRGTVMGWSNSSMSVIGILFGLLSGVLAVSGWRNAYLGYLAAIPMLVMIALFLPNMKRYRSETAKADGSGEENISTGAKKAFPVLFWIAIICFFIIVVAFNMMAYYVSFYVAEHNLGNEAIAGVASTAISVGSFLFCMCFGKIYGKLHIQTLTFCSVVLAGALALLYFLPNLAVALIALVMVGGSYGSGLTYCYTAGAELAPEGRVDSAMGIVTATYAIGGFLSTYISTWLMNAMNTNGTITPTLIVPMILMLAAAVVFPIAVKN